jgi:PhzF family phenazine biosynthesis protein
MKIPIVQVDAFTSEVFRGNPAAICPLERWLDDRTLQSIAAENNLSETAYLVGGNGRYEIRWMTPTAEVDLCGHATLASAFVLFGGAEKGRDEVVFRSKSGELKVRRDGDLLTLDFPARPPQPMTASEDLLEGLGRPPREVWAARDYLAVFETEDEVRTLAPDFGRLTRVDRFAVIATAPGTRVDFVSRFFAPRQGIPEDPVTGSAHCTLVPFWSRRLGKKKLHALQVSARGGELFCEDRGDRVAISGRAVRYLQGTIEI